MVRGERTDWVRVAGGVCVCVCVCACVRVCVCWRGITFWWDLWIVAMAAQTNEILLGCFGTCSVSAWPATRTYIN